MAGRKRARVWIAVARHHLDELEALRGRAGVEIVPIEAFDQAGQPRSLTIGEPVPELRPDVLLIDQRYSADDCPRDARVAVRALVDDLWVNGGLTVSWGAPIKEGHEDPVASEIAGEPVSQFEPTTPILPWDVSILRKRPKYGLRDLICKKSIKRLARAGVRASFSVPVTVDPGGKTFVLVDREHHRCEILLRAKDSEAVLGICVRNGQSQVVAMPALEVTLQEVVEHFLRESRSWPSIRRPRPAVPVLAFDDNERKVTFMGKILSLTPTAYAVLRYYASNAGTRIAHKKVKQTVLGTAGRSRSSLANHVAAINKAARATARRVSNDSRRYALDVAKSFLVPQPGRPLAYRLKLTQDQVVGL